MPRLCAFGCVPFSGVPMHRFPNLNKVPELFKTWVTLVGGKLNEPSDYEYYKKKRICDIHFTERDRNRNNRLNAEAVPTLHLPEQFVSPVLLEQGQPVNSGQDSQHATASHSSGTDTSKDLSAAEKHVRLEHNYDVTRSTPDTKVRRGPNSTAVSSPQPQSQPQSQPQPQTQSPVKAGRTRSSSVSSPAPAQPTRKRTSSGVFQVDDAEPPPKKVEIARSNSDGPGKKPEVFSNGRRKTVDLTDGDKDRPKDKAKQKKIDKPIETFDSEAKGKTVPAFKESDSWD